MKHELLIPVGNMDSVYFAIHNGADAIYLGMKSFTARAYATNFTEEEIIKVIKYSHLYGVRVYVTMNILVKETEVEEFLNKIEFLHKNNVDAVIMQDFGMINLVRKMYPNLEIHASTQTNNSSIDTIKLFYEMGVKRVVVSREMTIEEINSINIPIEIETFIHGALCISYSGNCLMSSSIGTRSGNRGQCAGSCRLKYSLYQGDNLIEKDKYLLSTKELNTSSKINELLKSNITSFKIEGRMKSSTYVGFITKFYRTLIDKTYFDLETETEKLKTIFNRDYTLGNLFNSKDLINNISPNHKGIKIGKVIELTKDKITIKLDKELNQEDGIRFMESKKGMIVNFLYDKKDNLMSRSNSVAILDNKIDLKTYDTVNKTTSKTLDKEIENYSLKKINISIKLNAKLNTKLQLTISDNINNVTVEGNKVEPARTSSITSSRIEQQLTKLGNTPFICNNAIINSSENIFISIKELNDLRREAVEKLIALRENTSYEFIKKEVIFNKDIKQVKNTLTASCYSEDQLNTLLNLDIDRIYLRNKKLYNKYKTNPNVYLYLDRNCFNIAKESNTLVNEVYKVENNNVIGNYSLNITNSYTLYYLKELGFSSLCLSVELTENEINSIITNYNKLFGNVRLEVLSFGRVENMIIKGNILNLEENKFNYNLIDLRKRKFPVYFDGVNTHILNYQNKYESSNLSKRLDFYNESSKEIEEIINSFK